MNLTVTEGARESESEIRSRRKPRADAASPHRPAIVDGCGALTSRKEPGACPHTTGL